jgi:hypothetical protein
VALAVTSAPPACNKGSKALCYKGRLEVRGICSNFTIAAVDGNLPGTQASWTDETTGKMYSNVFRPLNPCGIPDTLKEGDTFYFVVDTTSAGPCTTCKAYYPVPQNALNIRVLSGPCAGK